MYSSFPSTEWGGLIRSRGPPEEGATTLADYLYEYDISGRLVVLDLTNLVYAVYDFTNAESPRLTEQGTIAIDDSGHVTSKTATRIYSDAVTLPLATPPPVPDDLTAYDAAQEALQTLIPDIDISAISRSPISSPLVNPGSLTVVLTYSDVQYFFSYDIQNQKAVLIKKRTPDWGTTSFKVIEYDDEGRQIRESKEDENAVLTVLKEYRYHLEGKIVTINFTNAIRTITVSKLNADGTPGETIQSGYFGVHNASGPCYSIGDVDADPASWKWYDYGADGIMVTADDRETSAPPRGVVAEPGPGRFAGG